jgi:NAD(P)-dependent dehydrogenase (short-subunit alcohol dehydrogenase family)
VVLHPLQPARGQPAPRTLPGRGPEDRALHAETRFYQALLQVPHGDPGTMLAAAADAHRTGTELGLGWLAANADMARGAALLMLGRTAVSTSTMFASFGQTGLAAYGASRAALELLTKAWAAEYGPHGVRVNAVAPGPTRTPMNDAQSACLPSGAGARFGVPARLTQARMPRRVCSTSGISVALAGCCWRGCGRAGCPWHARLGVPGTAGL